MQRIIFLFIACLYLSLTACTKEDSLKKGVVAAEKSPAPDVFVTSLANGSSLKLSDLKGKVVSCVVRPCHWRQPNGMGFEPRRQGRKCLKDKLVEQAQDDCFVYNLRRAGLFADHIACADS